MSDSDFSEATEDTTLFSELLITASSALAEATEDTTLFSELLIDSSSAFVDLRTNTFGSQYGAGKYGVGPYGGSRQIAAFDDDESPEPTTWTEINEI